MGGASRVGGCRGVCGGGGWGCCGYLGGGPCGGCAVGPRALGETLFSLVSLAAVPLQLALLHGPMPLPKVCCLLLSAS